MNEKKILKKLWDNWLIPSIESSIKKGISQDEIARRTGVSQGLISSYLRGERRDGVKFRTVLQILSGLEVSMVDVISDLYGPDQADQFVKFYQTLGPELAENLLKLYQYDKDALNKVQEDVAFYTSRMKNQ